MKVHSAKLNVILVLISFFLVAGSFTACSKSSSEKEKPAIRVNNETISEKEFDSVLQREISALAAQYKRFGREFNPQSEDAKRFISQIKQKLSQDMVQRLLILDAAKKAGIKVDNAEVDEQLKHIKERFGTEGFENFKKEMGFDEAYIKQDISKQMMIRKYLDSLLKDVKVDDKEVAEYFEKNHSKYDQPEMIRASHILLKTEKEAEDIRKKVKAGEDFSELAFKFSIDPSAKQNKGDLNYFPRGVMDKTFEDAAFSMKKGEISKPVKTRFGYHIIKLVDRKPAVKATLEGSKEKILNDLTDEKKNKIIGDKLAELQKVAKIEINIDFGGPENDKTGMEKK